MRIPRQMYEEMVGHARSEAPNEACGMIAGRDGQVEQLYPAINIEHSPLRFMIDPKEQLKIANEIEAAGLELAAIYHSHTRTEPKPSETDLTFAKLWPGVLWVIVGLAGDDPDVRTWRIDDGRVAEADLVVE